MHPFYQDNYQFCPRCGQKLHQEAENLACNGCQFKIYNNPAVAVMVLIINQEKNQILLSQRKFEPFAHDWDTIGGFIQAGESAEQAIHRETEEEIGVQVKILDFLGSYPGNYEAGPTGSPVLDLAYVAQITGGEIKANDDVLQAKWWDFDHLPTNFAFERNKAAILLLINQIKEGVYA